MLQVIRFCSSFLKILESSIKFPGKSFRAGRWWCISSPKSPNVRVKESAADRQKSAARALFTRELT